MVDSSLFFVVLGKQWNSRLVDWKTCLFFTQSSDHCVYTWTQSRYTDWTTESFSLTTSWRPATVVVTGRPCIYILLGGTARATAVAVDKIIDAWPCLVRAEHIPSRLPDSAAVATSSTGDYHWPIMGQWMTSPFASDLLDRYGFFWHFHWAGFYGRKVFVAKSETSRNRPKQTETDGQFGNDMAHAQ